MSEQIPFIQPMTAEQTIQALKRCIDNNVNACDNCPIDKHIKDDCACCRYLAENALNLINELKNEYCKLVSTLCKQAVENAEKDNKERGMTRVQLNTPQIKIKPKIIVHVDGKEIDITKFMKEV